MPRKEREKRAEEREEEEEEVRSWGKIRRILEGTKRGWRGVRYLSRS
jgi:hypothetical protein